MTYNLSMINRIHGLDLARFFAFMGMVIVNFKVAMPVEKDFLWQYANVLEGKAAAIFVILAGIGVSLGAKKIKVKVLLKRATFLFVIGLINATIFEADILHYYGVYLVIGAFLLSRSSSILLIFSIGSILLSFCYLWFFDYSAGWDWERLVYLDFWSPSGFLRNLFFNGFHPTLPWISFLLLGMWIGRQDIANRQFQIRMGFVGGFLFLVSESTSRLLIFILADFTPDLSLEDIVALFGTTPMPPNIFYIIASSGIAVMVISTCLIIAEKFSDSIFLKPLLKTGKLALTLYIAHIIIGMGVLEEMGRLKEKQNMNFVLLSALIFCIFSIIFSIIWLRFFKHGPIEGIMRKLTS